MTSLAVQTLPDVERDLVAWLKSQPELAELDGRVYTAFPAKAGATPLLVVHRYGGEPKLRRPLVLDEALVQVDVYGGSKADVARLSALVRALLADRHVLVVLGAMRPQPDETFSPPRPRNVVDLTYYTRPAAPDARSTSSAAPSSTPEPTPGKGT